MLALSLPLFCRRHRVSSGSVVHDHFPDVMALALQHGPGAADRHPDHGLGCCKRGGRHHELRRFDLYMQKRRAELRGPGLDGVLELTRLRDAASPQARRFRTIWAAIKMTGA